MYELLSFYNSLYKNNTYIFHYSLFTIHFPLFTFHFSLFTFHFSLLVNLYSPLSVDDADEVQLSADIFKYQI